MTGGAKMRLALVPFPLLIACTWPQDEGVSRSAQVEVIEDLVPLDWRDVATPADQARLAHADEAWARGLAAAAGFRSAIAAEGAFLDPAVALPRAAPSPGVYLCRVVKLGGRPALAIFRPHDCFIDAEGDLLTMIKASGSKRPAGRLWPDRDTRLVFLGALGAEGEAPPAYGADDESNVAGFLERVAPFRWRLAVPYPQGGGILDVYELMPMAPAD